MSRHRNIKNLCDDDYYDQHDDYYDEEYDDEYDYSSEAEETAAPVDEDIDLFVAQVKSLVPPQLFTDTLIRSTLLKMDYNIDRTVAALLASLDMHIDLKVNSSDETLSFTSATLNIHTPSLPTTISSHQRALNKIKPAKRIIKPKPKPPATPNNEDKPSSLTPTTVLKSNVSSNLTNSFPSNTKPLSTTTIQSPLSLLSSAAPLSSLTSAAPLSSLSASSKNSFGLSSLSQSPLSSLNSSTPLSSLSSLTPSSLPNTPLSSLNPSSLSSMPLSSLNPNNQPTNISSLSSTPLSSLMGRATSKPVSTMNKNVSIPTAFSLPDHQIPINLYHVEDKTKPTSSSLIAKPSSFAEFFVCEKQECSSSPPKNPSKQYFASNAIVYDGFSLGFVNKGVIQFDASSKKQKKKANTFIHTKSLFIKDDEMPKSFGFDKPSPDDVVLGAMEKGKAQANKVKNSTVETKLKTLTISQTTSNPSISTKNSPAPSKKKTTLGSIDLRQKSQDPNNSSTSLKSLPMSRSSSYNTALSSTQSIRRIDVLSEYQRAPTKTNLNIVVVGHVDAGKSTMMGHLLYLLGEIDDRIMKRLVRDSEKLKKGSFAFAWVLDETDVERERGVTVDVAVNKFRTADREFTVLDAPGHRDFIPNMISGAAQADVAILVIDSITNAFESGFDCGGQTREHALLLRSLGVSQLIVCINKLDMMNWNESRYTEIISKLNTFLLLTGFKESNIAYIPTSGYTGENLKTRTVEKLGWYTGPTLVEKLNVLELPVRNVAKGLRLSVVDFFKGGIGAAGGGGVSIRGRIESGNIQVGESVIVRPVNAMAVVKSIEVGEESVKWAVAGDNVFVSLNQVDETHIHSGSVLCNPETPIPVTSHFRAQIVTFDIARPLVGDDLVLIQGSLKEECRISKLISIVNKSTGAIEKNKPRFLPKNTTAIVEIKLKLAHHPICLETFKDCKELGRFMLRLGGASVCAGIVLEILKFEKGGNGEE